MLSSQELNKSAVILICPSAQPFLLHKLLCRPTYYLCNKNSCADVKISITIRIQALRDVFFQINKSDCTISLLQSLYVSILIFYESILNVNINMQ
jgi:hypothetical protein